MLLRGGARSNGRWIRSIEADRLVRAVEREGGDGDGEVLAVRGFHLVAADHDAGGRVERRAAGVFVAFAGRQHGLLADYARPAHFLDAAEAVGDTPVTPAQLHRLAALVLDAHMISPHIVIVARRRL